MKKVIIEISEKAAENLKIEAAKQRSQKRFGLKNIIELKIENDYGTESNKTN